LPPREVSAKDYDNPQLMMQLNALIDTALRKGVIVVGGLPTVFEDDAVSDGAVSRIRELYESHGACFLALPNRSQYPRSDFFDTSDHLQEEFQIAHSTALAPFLAEVSRTSACPR
jgi:hypothetical protein